MKRKDHQHWLRRKAGAHSKEPWYFDEDKIGYENNANDVIIPTHGVNILAGDKKVVCRITPNKHVSLDELRANAHLILNGPTLYSELLDGSPAIHLLKHVWDSMNRDSWGRINGAMRVALSLAIGSGVEFEPDDFKRIYASPRKDGFNGGYWIGSEPEWIYSHAIENGNASCYRAWEAHTNRKPFFANNVDGRSYAASYIHTSQMHSDRCRAAVGFEVPYVKQERWKVTSFDDEAGCIRIALYGNGDDRKPKKLRKFTHEQWAALFPAPKKQKKANLDA